MRRVAGALVASVLSVAGAAPAPVAAWDAVGHRVVADLAARQLTPEARQEVRSLLDGSGMASVADWADQIRNQRPKTRPWHFVDIPRGEAGYDAARDCRNDDCVIGALEHELAILRDRSRSKAARAEALQFVIHFVGDLHQPLHCADDHDRGGNQVTVRWFRRKSNLHHVWDSDILAEPHLSEPELVARLRPQLDVPDVQAERSGTLVEWANESHRIAVGEAYPIPANHILDEAYYVRVAPLVERQLVRAGIRLAQLLNDSLGEKQGRGASTAELTPPPSEPLRTSSASAARASCPIKGNISSSNRRLYHRPDCPSYDRVLIDASKGERCFDTEAEALAAGWKAAGNCP